MAVHYSEGASRQFVPGGSRIELLHVLPSRAWLVLVMWSLPGLLGEVQFMASEGGPQA